MIGSKEFMSVTILIIVIFGWLTLIISLWLNKWLGLKSCLIIILKAFGKQLSYLVWIATFVICCGDHMHLRVFLVSYIVLNLLTLLGLGMCIVWYVKKFIIQISQIWEILSHVSVFGLIEISGPKLSNIFFMRTGLIKVLYMLMISLIHLVQVAHFLKNLFWTLIFPTMTEGNIISLWNAFPVCGLMVQTQMILISLMILLPIFLDVQKVPKFTYSVFTKTSIPVNRIAFWDNIADTDDHEDTDWEEIYRRNFKCSINTRLRSFYFKVF